MYFDFIKDLKYSKIVLGLNDTKLSEYLNISRSTVIRWLNNTITPEYDTLDKVYNKLYESNIYLNRVKEEMYNSSVDKIHMILFHGSKTEIIGEP